MSLISIFNNPEEGKKTEIAATESPEKSRLEQGAELRREVLDGVKNSAKRLLGFGGRMFKGLGRIGGQGLDAAFYGVKVSGSAVEKTARFVSGAPDNALDAVGSALAAGAEVGKVIKGWAVEGTTDFGIATADAAIITAGWTKNKLGEGADWTQERYASLKEGVGKRMDALSERADAARNGFVERVGSARNWYVKFKLGREAARKAREMEAIEESLKAVDVIMLKMASQKRELKEGAKARRKELKGLMALQAKLVAA